MRLYIASHNRHRFIKLVPDGPMDGPVGEDVYWSDGLIHIHYPFFLKFSSDFDPTSFQDEDTNMVMGAALKLKPHPSGRIDSYHCAAGVFCLEENGNSVLSAHWPTNAGLSRAFRTILAAEEKDWDSSSDDSEEF